MKGKYLNKIGGLFGLVKGVEMANVLKCSNRCSEVSFLEGLICPYCGFKIVGVSVCDICFVEPSTGVYCSRCGKETCKKHQLGGFCTDCYDQHFV